MDERGRHVRPVSSKREITLAGEEGLLLLAPCFQLSIGILSSANFFPLREQSRLTAERRHDAITVWR